MTDGVGVSWILFNMNVLLQEETRSYNCKDKELHKGFDQVLEQ